MAGCTNGSTQRASTRSDFLLAWSDIEIADELRVLLDEEASRLDFVAHERLEDLIGHDRVVEIHAEDRACFRVHGCLPQLIRVHLAQTLVALHVHRATPLAVAEARRDVIALLDVVGVVVFLALWDAEERWLRDVDVA